MGTDPAREKRIAEMKKDAERRERTVVRWAKQGIVVQAGWNQPGKVDAIQLDFTPEEWVGLLNKEGPHLGVCCAEISAVRDIFICALREDRFIHSTDLETAATIMERHNRINPTATDPIGHLVRLYHKMQKHLVIRKPSERKASGKRHLGDAVHADMDGANVVLTTENENVNPTNRIVLPPEVVMQFFDWALANSVEFKFQTELQRRES